jgi:hypothetical protein
VLGQFFSHGEGFRGGIRVSAADRYSSNDGPEIFIAPQSHGGPDFKVYSLHANLLRSQRAFERWWTGGYDIAAGAENAYAASGPGGRRASVQELRRR